MRRVSDSYRLTEIRLQSHLTRMDVVGCFRCAIYRVIDDGRMQHV
jgi:hypothetical protein